MLHVTILLKLFTNGILVRACLFFLIKATSKLKNIVAFLIVNVVELSNQCLRSS